MIPLTDCKHGYLYRIQARNFDIGIFNSSLKAFIGIREKFGERYLAHEYHVETETVTSTATPLQELEQYPAERISNNGHIKELDQYPEYNRHMFQWLWMKGERYYKPSLKYCVEESETLLRHIDKLILNEVSEGNHDKVRWLQETVLYLESALNALNRVPK